jgi:N-acetylmuramoyl-L-alanine amidase
MKAGYSLTKIVIDAGHGGHDVGCLGKNGTREKDVALSIALKLGHYLETHFENVEVIYTRKTDVFVELHERAAIANNANASLFICVHCNSACYRDKKIKRDVCSEGTYGAETWVMGLHKSEANLEVAKRENEVVLLEKDYGLKYDGFDPHSPEANIIF